MFTRTFGGLKKLASVETKILLVLPELDAVRKGGHVGDLTCVIMLNTYIYV